MRTEKKNTIDEIQRSTVNYFELCPFLHEKEYNARDRALGPSIQDSGRNRTLEILECCIVYDGMKSCDLFLIISTSINTFRSVSGRMEGQINALFCKYC